MIVRKLKINCPIRQEVVSARECVRCGLCLPPGILKRLFKDIRLEPNRYGVVELVGCLRRSYFARTIKTYPTLRDVYILARGLAYHDFFSMGFDMNEVPLFKKFEGEDFVVVGIVDGISKVDNEIVMYEIKSVNRIPRKPFEHHELQIRSYYSIAKETIEVDRLELIYLGMNDFRVFEVKKKDITDFLYKRAKELHVSLLRKEPPITIDERLCRFCVFRNLCKLGETLKNLENEKSN